jgi:hypothetical protein
MAGGAAGRFLEPFVAPELKIERARHHYAAMIETLIDYQKIAKPTFIKTDRKIDPWQIEISEPVPTVVALQLGDIAHSLRSSLDVTMCDLAIVRGVGLSDMVYPFAANEARFLEMLDAPNGKQPFKKLGSDIVEIVAASKPYGGGDNLLRGLHDLNNHDKHRMAVPFVSFVSATATHNKELGPDVIMIGGPPVGIHVGVPVEGLEANDDPLAEYLINPTSMIVTFPREYVLFGNVVTTMGNLIDHVDDLVGRFKSAAGF